MNNQEIFLQGGRRGGGMSYMVLHNHYQHMRDPLKLYLTFNVNRQRVIVQLLSVCDMHSVVQFVANQYRVPARLVKFDKGVWSQMGIYDLKYNA